MGRHHDPHGRLRLTVLGGLAEFERELIKDRAGEGRKRAKDRGVKLGLHYKLSPYQWQEIAEALAEGATAAVLARRYNVSQQTIGRLRP